MWSYTEDRPEVLRALLRVQSHGITDAHRTFAKDAHVHPAPAGVNRLGDPHETSIAEGARDRPARTGERGDLDFDVADRQPDPGSDELPRQSRDRHVLADGPRHDRVPFGRQRIDALLRVQTERALWPAMDQRLALPVAVHAACVHRRRVDCALGHTTFRLLQPHHSAREVDAHLVPWPTIHGSNSVSATYAPPPGIRPLTMRTGIPPFEVFVTT